MYRVGIVRAQDTSHARVRVTFPDRDQMQSWWLPVVFPKTQNDKSYWMPDVGEQVVCMVDEYDEDGAVLGAIYSSADMMPTAANRAAPRSPKLVPTREGGPSGQPVRLMMPPIACTTMS